MGKEPGKVLKNRDLLALEKSFKPYGKKGSVRVCLVYPNRYKAGMSNLGFQTLYRLMNDQSNVSCERAFLPANSENVRSLEGNLKLASFDIIAFSISFENDYVNLVSLLQDAGIPLKSSDRNKFHPLVIAGGISCFLNPEPIAPFMDCILLGETESFIKQFFDIYNSLRSKEKILKELAEYLPSAYVPSFYKISESLDNIPKKPFPVHGYAGKSIKVNYVLNLNEISTTTSILTSNTTFKNIFLIETARGCPHGCRFCSAGFIYRPPRFYSKENILKSMEIGKRLTDKIGFVSAAVTDHPDINEICEHALNENLKTSFSSFRADLLSRNVLKSLGKASIKTATIAPEAGSQRMRNIINKNISENEILNCTNFLVSSGIFNLRLYFLIGLPFEKDEDIHAIVGLIKKIKLIFLDASKKQKKIGTITISINPFIPKPSTPFQWAGFTKEAILKKRFAIIRDGLKKVGNVVIKTESIKQAKINALLSRADRHGADVLMAACKSGWTNALKTFKEYIDPIVYNTWDMESDLPWDIVDTGLKKDFLRKEYKRAKQGKTTRSCPGIDCNKCRICKTA